MTRGVFAVLAAAVLFGTTGTAQELGPGGLDPLAVGAIRVVIAGVVLLALAAALGAYKGTRPSATLVLIGAVGVVLYQLGFFTGVRLGGVAIGTVVALGSGPVWAGIVEWRRPSPQWIAATVLAIAGVAVLTGGGTTSLLGIAASLTAGLGYGLYTVTGSKLIAQGQRSYGAMGLMFGAGAVLLAPVLALRWPGGLDSTPGMTVALYLALVPTVVAYLLFGAGLKVLPAATVATLTLAEPVVATTLGVVVLGEALTANTVIGALLVLGGLSLLALRPAGAASSAGGAPPRRSGRRSAATNPSR
ncbi:transporter [Lentzea sp. NBRC 105346]|uniref:DMT family transporter n=1 Tax=Lentzea sp. NBRC 105346 TaxID=3032205 RepID=UPI0024A364AE|nr:EamA family transporter [Lentzea sp. NBRC 105346]GLZ34959.1 transporter [Lentzea sp. NBRC 105346]